MSYNAKNTALFIRIAHVPLIEVCVTVPCAVELTKTNKGCTGVELRHRRLLCELVASFLGVAQCVYTSVSTRSVDPIC